MNFLNTTGNPSLDKELELITRRLEKVEQFVTTAPGGEGGTGPIINNTFITNEGGVTVREVGGTDYPIAFLEFDGADGYSVSSVTADTARIDRDASLTIPQDVGTAAAGSNTDAANSDHVHEGVHSISKSGSAALSGDVTLSAGANVTITQTGQDIAIAASAGGGGGGVTSVDATVPAEFVVSGVPITTAGTIAITKANEAANRVWAGPTAGAAAQPTFRSLVLADMMLTAKGQLLTFGTAPALQAVGANATILTADSVAANGLKWAAPAVQTSTLLNGTVHTDTAAQGPTKGSLVVGNAAPLWDELVVGTNYKILEADAAAANGVLWSSRGWSTVWGIGTPTVLGPDTFEERVLPYHPSDGTRSITWNVRRIWFRLVSAGGSPVVVVEKSSGSGLFVAAMIGTLTMPGGGFEVAVTAGLGTVSSGTKIRFNITALGTATGWSIGIEVGT